MLGDVAVARGIEKWFDDSGDKAVFSEFFGGSVGKIANGVFHLCLCSYAFSK